MAAKGCGASFGDDENMLKLIMVMIVQLYMLKPLTCTL